MIVSCECILFCNGFLSIAPVFVVCDLRNGTKRVASTLGLDSLAGVPLDKNEGPVKQKLSLAMRKHRNAGQKVEDKESGKHFYSNHLLVEAVAGGVAHVFA